MDRVKRIWYLSPMRAAKVQASLHIRAVSPEPSLLALISSESRRTFRQKARSLAPLNGWACAVTICHDGMLEDTNSLDGAHILCWIICWNTDNMNSIYSQFFDKGYKNLSCVWGADREICPRVTVWLCQVMPNSDPEGWIFLSPPNNHDRFFFLHTFWSPAFNFKTGFAINASHFYLLMSAILKIDIKYDITMTSTPNILTTELYDLLYNQCIENVLFDFYLSHGLDKGM